MQKYILSLITALLFCGIALFAQNSSGPCAGQPTNLIYEASIDQSSSIVPLDPLLGNLHCKQRDWGGIYTMQEASPWWQADLKAPAQLQSIQLNFSQSAYPAGLKNIYILTSAYPMEFNDLSTLLNSTAVQHLYIGSEISSGTVIPLGQRTARYVRVQAAVPMSLSFPSVSIMGIKNLYEIPNNNYDDDCDGLTDAADNDLKPVFRNVTVVAPSCPTCHDGAIHILAGGDNLSISSDGGTTFRPMGGDKITLPAESGSYSLVLSSGNGASTAYSQNPAIVPPPVVITCANGNFQNGWAGWTGGQGQHNTTPPNVAGTPFYLNNNILIGAPQQVILPSGGGNDPNVGNSIPLNSPSGQGQFARLGTNTNTGGQAQRLTYSFLVTNANRNFSFWFATVMWLHGAPDPIAGEPFFTWNVRVGNNAALGSGAFNPRDGVMTPTQNNANLFFTPWQCVNLDLSAIVGQVVTVRFESAGCAWGGHGGYAYIDGLCENPVAATVNLPATVCYNGGPVAATAIGGADYSGYFWVVERVDANGVVEPGTTVTGPIQTGAPINPLQDVIGFWTAGTGKSLNCNDRLRVTLVLRGRCTAVQVSNSRTIQYLCSSSTLDYCDMAVCNGAGSTLQTQATGSCPGCTFQWQPVANLNNPNIAFPTIANPAGVNKTYSVVITPPGGCSTTQTLEVWSTALNGTISGAVKCVDPCTVVMEAYFLTTQTFYPNRVVVSANAAATGNNLTFTYTSVENLPNGVKRYKFTSNPFANKGTGNNGSTPEVYTLTIRTITPPGFCNYGNCPTTLTVTVSVPRGLFHGIPNAYIPNVFQLSANNPVNQVFNPFFSNGIAAPGVYWMEMEIYDRWGGLIYRNSYDLNPTCATTQGLAGNEQGFPWNGYINNNNTVINGPNLCQQGVYVYIIRYRNCTQEFMQSGDVAFLW